MSKNKNKSIPLSTASPTHLLLSVQMAYILAAITVVFILSVAIFLRTLPYSKGYSPVELFFEALNKEDFDGAISYFSEKVFYEDTIKGNFNGRDALKQHWIDNANFVPPNAKFIIDKLAFDSAGRNIGATWHVNVDGVDTLLSGAGFYSIDSTGLISYGKSAH